MLVRTRIEPGRPLVPSTSWHGRSGAAPSPSGTPPLLRTRIGDPGAGQGVRYRRFLLSWRGSASVFEAARYGRRHRPPSCRRSALQERAVVPRLVRCRMRGTGTSLESDCSTARRLRGGAFGRPPPWSPWVASERGDDVVGVSAFEPVRVAGADGDVDLLTDASIDGVGVRPTSVVAPGVRSCLRPGGMPWRIHEPRGTGHRRAARDRYRGAGRRGRHHRSRVISAGPGSAG